MDIQSDKYSIVELDQEETVVTQGGSVASDVVDVYIGGLKAVAAGARWLSDRLK
jgi:hypothetical protein